MTCQDKEWAAATKRVEDDLTLEEAAKRDALYAQLADRRRRARMRETEIIDYARQLLDAHGGKAEAEAAAKARTFEEQGDADQAETWRRIRMTINELHGAQIG